VHALPCCAWALNIALLLLCNVYNGFTYIPFSSWAGAAGSHLICILLFALCIFTPGQALLLTLSSKMARTGPQQSPISSKATNTTLADTIGRFSSTSHSFA
jgi:hypothetical protein